MTRAGRPRGYSTQGQRLVRILLDLVHAWPKPRRIEDLAARHGVSPRMILRDLRALEDLGQAARVGTSHWAWGLGESTLQGAQSLFLRPLPTEERAALVGIAFGFKPRRHLRRAAGW